MLLYYGQYYHIYNRAVGNDLLFYEKDNYKFFLQKYFKYISEKVNTYAYCLLPNHFHFLIQPKIDDTELLSELFRKMFISNSMALNESINRRGNLFERNFKRKINQKDEYLKTTVAYIHFNPVPHKITNDYKNYKHNSYRILIDEENTKLQRQDVLKWFGDKKGFIDYHNRMNERELSEEFLIE